MSSNNDKGGDETSPVWILSPRSEQNTDIPLYVYVMSFLKCFRTKRFVLGSKRFVSTPYFVENLVLNFTLLESFRSENESEDENEF